MTNPNETPGGCVKAAEETAKYASCCTAPQLMVATIAVVVAEYSGAREALVVLRDLEWSGGDDCGAVCPVCEGRKISATFGGGHFPDCALAEALATFGGGHFPDCALAAAIRALEGK